MGRYRFKLSDRILRAWFYKLTDMSSKGRSNPISTTANNIHSRKQKQAHVSASTTAHPSKPRQPHPSNPRKSYYFTRDVASRVEFSDFQVAFETPRKSSKQKSRRRTSVRSSSPKLVSSCVSSGYSGRTKLESNWTKSDFPSEYSSSPDPEATDTEIRTDRLLPTESLDELHSSSSSSGYRVNSSANDIFIHVDNNSLAVKCDNKLDYHDTLPELEVELPPIITKPASAKFSDMASDVKKEETGDHKTYNRSRSVEYKEPKKQGPLRVKIVKQDITSTHEQRTGPVRKFSVSSPGPGVRLRSHYPKIASRKNQAQSRNSAPSIGGIHSNTRRNRSLSESFAVVKSSFDPQRDFRDSMAEMILENNIRESKDLEDLLACYLSLNSDEYHDLIIKVFKQLWFDLIDTR